jgi:hypothetical protein
MAVLSSPSVISTAGSRMPEAGTSHRLLDRTSRSRHRSRPRINARLTRRSAREDTAQLTVVARRCSARPGRVALRTGDRGPDDQPRWDRGRSAGTDQGADPSTPRYLLDARNSAVENRHEGRHRKMNKARLSTAIGVESLASTLARRLEPGAALRSVLTTRAVERTGYSLSCS